VKQDTGFQAALDALARFWRYSPFNQFCILLQRRGATRVAGRRVWESMGRSVKTGERPVAVFAPVRRGAAYTLVPVYDIRQTRGRRVPKFDLLLRGRSRHVRTLERAATRLAIQVSYILRLDGSEARSFGGRIELNPGLPERERVSALAHELAHEVLHQAERKRAAEAKRPPPSRSHAECETEAEATAWVVLAVLGLPARSPTYIAWQGGDGAAVLKSMTRIQRAAKVILEAAGIAGRASRRSCPSKP